MKKRETNIKEDEIMDTNTKRKETGEQERRNEGRMKRSWIPRRNTGKDQGGK
jgi:hypothetical protein